MAATTVKLEQLNLASTRDSGETGDLIAKLEAFFESQRRSQEDFNNRMEQRVLEELGKEREKAAAPPSKRLSKELTVSQFVIATTFYTSDLN